MTERGKEQGPFDERAALGELERFRADIERYRKQREVVSEDFEEFVRSFPSPVDVFPSEQPAAGSPGIRDFGSPAASQASSTQAAQPARPAQRAVPTPAPPPPATKSPVETARPATAPAPQATKVEKPKRTGMPLVATLLLLLIVAAVGVWMFRGGQLQPQTSNGETAQPAAPVATAPAPAPPAVAPAPVESEITTVRRAWVRVIADGERVLERELPADTRVPFKAEKTIVIRTGDAGAVRLTIRGEDHGTLGRDGEVVTRSFTVPANQPR